MNLKTKIHYYAYNIGVPSERIAYEKLCEELRVTPGRGNWMNCISGGSVAERLGYGKEGKSEEIELETKHLFKNQWNSTTHRVFDWYEEVFIDNQKLKKGHYLDITPEMVMIRIQTLKCGYTGQQFPSDYGFVFNETAQALGSPYLKETELHLLRLLPIATPFNHKRPELTESEKAYLLPKYIAAQTEGANTREGQRKIEQRANIEKEYSDEIKTAETKYKGFTWLMNHNVSMDNVIYYSHTNRFAFGWRTPISEGVKSKLLDVLVEFPFDYDIVLESHTAMIHKDRND